MSKRKLTAAEKQEKKRRRALYETIFVGGKQKRVKRVQPLVEGIEQGEFIRRNADPIWLHASGMWECDSDTGAARPQGDEGDLPF